MCLDLALGPSLGRLKTVRLAVLDPVRVLTAADARASATPADVTLMLVLTIIFVLHGACNTS